MHKLKYSTHCKKKGGIHTFVKEEVVVANLNLDDSVFSDTKPPHLRRSSVFFPFKTEIIHL